MQRVSRSRFCDILRSAARNAGKGAEKVHCTRKTTTNRTSRRSQFSSKKTTFGEVVCLQEIYFMADDYIYSIFFNKFVEAYSVALKYDLGVSPGFTRKINFLYQSRAVFKVLNSFITERAFPL